MATNKSFTDVNQAKVLAEILPIESADGHWYNGSLGLTYSQEAKDFYDSVSNEYLPAWSLLALLNVLPVIDLYAPSLKMKLTHRYYVEVYLSEQKRYIATDDYDNPVDACVAIIEKLNELKML